MKTINKKYILITIILIVMIVAIFLVKNLKNDSDLSKNEKPKDEVETIVNDLRNELNNSDQTFDITSEFTNEESKSIEHIKEIVIVQEDSTNNTYNQGILELKEKKFLKDDEFILRYEGKLLPTDDPISTSGYPYLFFEEEKAYANEEEKNSILQQKEYNRKTTFSGFRYSGDLHLIDEGNGYFVFGGYLTRGEEIKDG